MESPQSSNTSDDRSSIAIKTANSEDDKKFASQAVAFVIKHSRKGIVPLCASVATLFQEQDRLKKELKTLQEYVKQFQLNGSSYSPICSKSTSISSEHSHSLSSIKENDLKLTDVKIFDVTKDFHSQESMGKHDAKELTSKVLKQKHENDRNLQNSSKSIKKEVAKKLPGRFIAGCLCDQCQNKETLGGVSIKPPLKHEETVVIQGHICGAVKYVGHLNCVKPSDIFVGIQLDEPVGDTNGTVKEKTYFNCPKNYGMIVPLSDVRCVIR